MKVTEVQVMPIKPVSGLVGFASVVIDDEIYLGSIGIHVRLDGTFRITYPTKKVGAGQLNIFHPIRREAGRLIEQAIIVRCEEIFNEKREESYDRYNQNRNQII